MIDLIPSLPANVVGFVASGQVTASDYESVLIPAIQSRLQHHEKVRVLYQLGPRFSGFSAGAMWDDAKLGFAHLNAWEKIAIVTDVDWIESAIGIFKFAIPCPIKIFSNSHYTRAETWIAD